MSEPKVHHFVPRLYLRGFANTKDQVAVRDRKGRAYITSTRNVMARSGLYRVPGQSSNAESALGRIESETVGPLRELRTGSLPSRGSPNRSAIARFMAIQTLRDIDDNPLFGMVRALRKRFECFPVSRQDTRRFLAESYGFEPSSPEVNTAWEMANFLGTGSLDEAQMKTIELDAMFDVSQRAAPILENLVWSLAASKREDFITSDRPVVLWRPPRPQDNYRGVGLQGAKEVWLPVDRRRILILTKRGRDRVRRIRPGRVDSINQHIARHCRMAIVSHPSMATKMDGLHLAERRPTWRFNQGPAFDRVTGAKVSDEIWHIWRPIRDIPD